MKAKGRCNFDTCQVDQKNKFHLESLPIPQIGHQQQEHIPYQPWIQTTPLEDHLL